MEEKLDFLIKYLTEDIGEKVAEIPVTLDEKEKVWRALCNIRKPNSISEEYLKVQDEFLQERLSNFFVVNAKDIKEIDELYPNKKIACANRMSLWQGDLTHIKCDCIVNAANSRGLGCFQPMHNCIDNQVQTYSGVQMRLECNEYMQSAHFDFGLPTSEVFITKGYNLPAKYVIHTVGPVISFSVSEENKQALKDCYTNALKLAVQKGLKTIAFPCISTGIFRFPRRLAVDCAVTAVQEFLENDTQIEKVIFNVFGDENLEIYENYFEKYEKDN